MRIFLDHLRRVFVALGGFRVHGARWIRPWVFYALSPFLNRAFAGRLAHFSGFNARLGEGDLYTFANTFEDYPTELVRRALRDVEVVVDLGANVGAFAHLVTVICAQEGFRRRIRAVEPNKRNVEFLRTQPFASAMEIHSAAVGAAEGTARLVAGQNSVTDHIEFSENAVGSPVRVLDFASLCDRPALVKMDIEGGEWTILPQGLPETVRHLFLEWHPRRAETHASGPREFIAGDWKEISVDLYGSSMWYLRR